MLVKAFLNIEVDKLMSQLENSSLYSSIVILGGLIIHMSRCSLRRVLERRSISIQSVPLFFFQINLYHSF